MQHAILLCKKRVFSFTFLTLSFLSVVTVLQAQPVVTFTPYVNNFIAPLAIKNAGDGSNRLFVAQQSGQIRIIKNGVQQPKSFLDIKAKISKGYNNGFYDFVFSPNYETDRYFYVLYYAKTKSTIVARYQVSSSNPDSALPESEAVLFTIPGNGTGGPHFGNMQFGPDNYLYLSLSDGSFFTTTLFAQNITLIIGKMLRINVLNVNAAPYYTIPPDNPLLNVSRARPEIWAVGFRNAWRWSFDRLTGDMWIGDVGDKGFEEVDFQRADGKGGLNYGFACYEADSSFIPNGCSDISRYTFPIFAYPHQSATSGETLTGGFVYRGAAYPSLYGYYLCTDYTTGTTYKIRRNGATWLASPQPGTPTGIVGYGEDESGELYATSLETGIVYRIGAAAAPASSESNAAVNAYTIKSKIYPTIVYNQTLMLDMQEAYKSVHVYDIAGNEMMHRSLNGTKEKYMLQLPSLKEGWYIVKLQGEHQLQQKIYIAK